MGAVWLEQSELGKGQRSDVKRMAPWPDHVDRIYNLTDVELHSESLGF